VRSGCTACSKAWVLSRLLNERGEHETKIHPKEDLPLERLGSLEWRSINLIEIVAKTAG
jgi:hypothetical protein